MFQDSVFPHAFLGPNGCWSKQIQVCQRRGQIAAKQWLPLLSHNNQRQSPLPQPLGDSMVPTLDCSAGTASFASAVIVSRQIPWSLPNFPVSASVHQFVPMPADILYTHPMHLVCILLGPIDVLDIQAARHPLVTSPPWPLVDMMPTNKIPSVCCSKRLMQYCCRADACRAHRPAGTHKTTNDVRINDETGRAFTFMSETSREPLVFPAAVHTALVAVAPSIPLHVSVPGVRSCSLCW